jgi:hypothetical protein
VSAARRGIAALVVFLGVYGMTWVLMAVLLPERLFAWLGFIGPLVAGAVAARHVRRHGLALDGPVGARALRGAALLGSIGFVAGFFGPMLLAPDANQGPLLGLFVLGPGGALAGALLGVMSGRPPD